MTPLADQLDSLPASWKHMLQTPQLTATWQALQDFLEQERQAGHQIYPSTPFTALQHTPLEAVKVVILGQDPYHGEGQAHGLSFSVLPGVKAPPSLKNIFKELQHSGQISSMPAHGHLSGWADQGVLLLNTVMTVRAGEAGSHRKRGWEIITDHLIHALAASEQPMVFMLWGSDAQKKKPLLDTASHLILEAPHPSPLSAHRGFIGCGHFKTANEWLQAMGRSPIEWDRFL
ncbi:uracil-DNA glycosylase [Leeia oryzae]|uniref:uracil-DNA glycosylase n=1 Tax=Leeia oryzae TaxID=356662 RepID=UPI00036BB1D1|nr:uracil-DNA glycosylase [Leeia oryzae]